MHDEAEQRLIVFSGFRDGGVAGSTFHADTWALELAEEPMWWVQLDTGEAGIVATRLGRPSGSPLRHCFGFRRTASHQRLRPCVRPNPRARATSCVRPAWRRCRTCGSVQRHPSENTWCASQPAAYGLEGWSDTTRSCPVMSPRRARTTTGEATSKP